MMPERSANNAYAVILVGGKGKRLRPLSTDRCPKAFISVTRDRNSMFKNTVKRIRRLIPSSNIVIVANKMHAKLVKRDFPHIREENLILEPVSRNTAPAVGLAVSIIRSRNRDAVVVILPTDHYIRDEKRQLKTIENAIRFLNRNVGAIVVFGITPTFPSTEFGYIKIANSEKRKIARVGKVEKFVEKPCLRTAQKYIKSGRYLWNSGAFCFTADTLLRAIKDFAPEIYRNLDIRKIGRRYEKMPDISLDYAIMEKSKNIYFIRGSYGWNDIGSFKALRRVLKKESRRFAEEDGKIVRIF